MNAIRKTTQINNQELAEGTSISASWHNDYNDTAYIYIGGLESKLTEMDIATVFSQFGNPTHVKLSRDPKTGKSRGFAWLKYEDQRSTVLAVDNFNGVELLGRTVRVDHTYYESRDEEGDAKEVEMLNKARDKHLKGGQPSEEPRESESRRGDRSRGSRSSRDRSPERERRSHRSSRESRSSRDRSPDDRERSHRRSRRSRDDDRDGERSSRRSRDDEEDVEKEPNEESRRDSSCPRRSRDDEGSSRRSRDDDGSSRRSRDDDGSPRRSRDDDRSSRRSRDDDRSSRRSRADGSRERHRKRSRRDRSRDRGSEDTRDSEKPREPAKPQTTANQDPDLVDPMAAYFANKK
ncbi:U2 snRNP component IST3 [Yarrowia sp. B02]|nr:U2 snRNP component IST3 [Yarrowia sp. B02]